MFLISPLTRHCFTASEPFQYPDEVSLVPCKHSCTASGPIQYLGVVTHTSLIASIILLRFHPYRYLYLCVKIACATFLGVLIEAGWYSESLFDLLRIPHLLLKVYPIGINLIQSVQMLDFNVCKWNPYKRPAKNLKLSHRCIG